MLKGAEFGKAIGVAINRKIEADPTLKKAAIARHFGMKPPSLADWVKKGSVAKDKLPEVWRFFADVAGPEHWGLTASEWPAGLSTSFIDSTSHRVSEPVCIYLAPPMQKEEQEKRLAVAFSNDERLVLDGFRLASQRERDSMLHMARLILEDFNRRNEQQT